MGNQVPQQQTNTDEGQYEVTIKPVNAPSTNTPDLQNEEVTFKVPAELYQSYISSMNKSQYTSSVQQTKNHSAGNNLNYNYQNDHFESNDCLYKKRRFNTCNLYSNQNNSPITNKFDLAHCKQRSTSYLCKENNKNFANQPYLNDSYLSDSDEGTGRNHKKFKSGNRSSPKNFTFGNNYKKFDSKKEFQPFKEITKNDSRLNFNYSKDMSYIDYDSTNFDSLNLIQKDRKCKDIINQVYTRIFTPKFWDDAFNFDIDRSDSNISKELKPTVLTRNSQVDFVVQKLEDELNTMIGEEKLKNYQLSATKNIEGEKVEITMTPKGKVEEFSYKTQNFSTDTNLNSNSIQEELKNGKELSENSNFFKNKQSPESISANSQKYPKSQNSINNDKIPTNFNSSEKNSLASSKDTKKRLSNTFLSQKPVVPKIANLSVICRENVISNNKEDYLLNQNTASEKTKNFSSFSDQNFELNTHHFNSKSNTKNFNVNYLAHESVTKQHQDIYYNKNFNGLPSERSRYSNFNQNSNLNQDSVLQTKPDTYRDKSSSVNIDGEFYPQYTSSKNTRNSNQPVLHFSHTADKNENSKDDENFVENIVCDKINNCKPNMQLNKNLDKVCEFGNDVKNGVFCQSRDFEESHLINHKKSVNVINEREKVFSSDIFHSGTFRKMSEDQLKNHIMDKTACSSEDINLMQNSNNVFVEIKEKCSGRITSQNNRYTVRESEALTLSPHDFCNTGRTNGSTENQNISVLDNSKNDESANNNKHSFAQKNCLNLDIELINENFDSEDIEISKEKKEQETTPDIINGNSEEDTKSKDTPVMTTLNSIQFKIDELSRFAKTKSDSPTRKIDPYTISDDKKVVNSVVISSFSKDDFSDNSDFSESSRQYDEEEKNTDKNISCKFNIEIPKIQLDKINQNQKNINFSNINLELKKTNEVGTKFEDIKAFLDDNTNNDTTFQGSNDEATDRLLNCINYQSSVREDIGKEKMTINEILNDNNETPSDIHIQGTESPAFGILKLEQQSISTVNLNENILLKNINGSIQINSGDQALSKEFNKKQYSSILNSEKGTKNIEAAEPIVFDSKKDISSCFRNIFKTDIIQNVEICRNDVKLDYCKTVSDKNKSKDNTPRHSSCKKDRAIDISDSKYKSFASSNGFTFLKKVDSSNMNPDNTLKANQKFDENKCLTTESMKGNFNFDSIIDNIFQPFANNAKKTNLLTNFHEIKEINIEREHDIKNHSIDNEENNSDVVMNLKNEYTKMNYYEETFQSEILEKTSKFYSEDTKLNINAKDFEGKYMSVNALGKLKNSYENDKTILD